MEIQCPHCGKSFSGTGEEQNCPHCGAPVSERTPDEHEESGEYYCPWDDRDNLGFFKALVDTWMQSMFNPVRFFSKMPREGGLAGPLLYGFIVGEIGFLFSLMWEGMSVVIPPFVDQPGFGDMVGEAVGMTFFFFASPAIVLAMLFIFSAILHACLLIVGGAQKSFETTFRVVCYASSTDLLEIIPVCGWFIGLVWYLVLTVIGVRETHEIPTGRAALAVLLPAVFCCGCIALVLLIALPHFIN